MKRLMIIVSIIIFSLGMIGCSENTIEKNDEIFSIYTLAVNANETDLTYEEWLETVRGPEGLPGEDGKNVLLSANENYILWQNEGDDTWNNLISLETISGDNGEEVSFMQNNGIMYWKYVGQEEWEQLFSMNELIEYSLNAYYVNTVPDYVNMSNLDSLLGRKDIQYVDLRDFSEKWTEGYIQGFEVIPFHGLLERYEVLVRNSGWVFDFSTIKDQAVLVEMFDINKTIFLMCSDGTRSGFVKQALEAIGYENVYNIGGYETYHGDFNVETSMENKIELVPPLDEVIDMSNIDNFLGRPDVQYIDVRNFDDKLNSGYIEGFGMIPFFDYLEYVGILKRTDGWSFEAASLQNESALSALFNEDKAIFLMCGSGTRAGFVKAALESIGYTRVYNIGGIADYEGEYKILGDGSYTIDMPVKGDYTPGIYYGLDETNGYMATVVISSAGGIEEVILNAVYVIDPDGIEDSGDEYIVTKQALQGDYGMLGITGKGWFEHANELAAALVANQGWNADWDIYDAGSHDKFNPEDDEVVMDGIAGVTIGIEGFKAAFEEAVGQAE